MQKYRIKCILSFKSFNFFHIKNNVFRIRQTLASWRIPLESCSFIGKPFTAQKYTLLQSPHIYKKSREQFERTKNKGDLVLCFYNLQHFLFVLFWLQNSQFPGVQIMVTLKKYTKYI